MATLLSPSELLDWLGQNQFLSTEQADALRPLLATFPESLDLAKELMRRDWLTPYQINQIMQGKQDQLVLGRYRLRERIGEGAMGLVFKAWSLGLERVVAVKTLTKELINNDKAMERFRREVALAAQLKHPNIALVRDAGEEDGKQFLVMDFIEGVNLSQRVKQKGALPIHEAVEYARQAALGLQHAFECGIVHRDIKPANLVVAAARTHGALPVVKILDFGLARFQSEADNDGRLTQVGRLLGTIDYIAPEQAQDARYADIRADIYSLGCSLYFLLTGRPPFEGNDIIEKLGPRVTGEAPWVRAQRPEVSPDLEAVLRKMMARRPDDRYQTPAEAAEALEPHTVPPPIALAVPVSSDGIVMAMPMGAIVPADNVPMATPVAAGIPPEAEPDREEDPSFLAMTATGRDMSSGTGAATPRAVKSNPSSTWFVVLLGSAAVLFSIIACAGVFGYFYFGGTPEKKTGILRIKEVKWSMPDKQAIPRTAPHQVHVWIERVDCKGKVTITLKDLPPGVRAGVTTLAPNADNDRVLFWVSFGTEPFRKEVKVFAECEEEGASAEMSVLLVVKEDPLKRKK